MSDEDSKSQRSAEELSFNPKTILKYLRNTNGDYLISKFDNFKSLGTGNFAKVFSGTKVSSKKLYAIKCIEINENNELSNVQKEIDIMNKLDHDCILKLKNVYSDDKKKLFGLILDFCIGNLFEIVYHHSSKISEDNLFNLLNPILQGLDYIHEQGMIHRDINASNLMITTIYHIVIGDFGSTSMHSKSISFVGSPFWMAPELAQGEEYDSKVDIWSLGIVIIEILDPKNQHFEKQVMKLLYEICFIPPPTLDQDDFPKVQPILNYTLNKNPKNRHSAKLLLNLSQIASATNHVYVLALLASEYNSNSHNQIESPALARFSDNLKNRNSIKKLDSHSVTKLSLTSDLSTLGTEKLNTKKTMRKLQRIRILQNTDLNKLDSACEIRCLQLKKLFEKSATNLNSQFISLINQYTKKCSNDEKYLISKSDKFTQNLIEKVNSFSVKLKKPNKKHKINFVYRIYHEFELSVDKIVKIIDYCSSIICQELVYESQASYFNELTQQLSELCKKILEDFFEKLTQKNSSNLYDINNANSCEQNYAYQKILLHVSSLYTEFLLRMKAHRKESQAPQCTDLYKQFKIAYDNVLTDTKKKLPSDSIGAIETFIQQRIEILSNHVCSGEKLNETNIMISNQKEAFKEYQELKEFINLSTKNNCKNRTDLQICFNIDMKNMANTAFAFEADGNYMTVKSELDFFGDQLKESRSEVFKLCKKLGVKTLDSFNNMLDLIKSEFKL